MINELVNVLSRLQFAVSGLFHFLFVDLTLGLGFLIALSETAYYITNDEYWKKITKFWGVIFGINFALGAATGLPLEFQFGTNWAYYSHYVGDIFGSILAMEGMIAFFLESTLLGIFFFGWKLVSRGVHLTCSWLLFFASNLSALFILIANGWMQHPVGSTLNHATMRMELTSFADIFFSVVAQCKFVHTLCSGYVYASTAMLGVSAYYLLKKRNTAFARRCGLLASCVGLTSSIFLIITGDESGFVDAKMQPMKLAAIEAVWNTEPAPADFTIFGWPNKSQSETYFAVKVPKILGIIATRSLTKEVPGINDLVSRNEQRIRNGLLYISAINKIKGGTKGDLTDKNDKKALEIIEEYKSDYGYALLLKRYRDDISNATPEEISKAARDTVPNVPVLFWAFRIMVGLGLLFFAFFVYAFYVTAKGKFTVNMNKWVLRLMVLNAPLPLVAAECGWIVAEMGRQPWTIDGVLPTIISGSNLHVSDVSITLACMLAFYSLLFIIGLAFVLRHIAKGEV